MKITALAILSFAIILNLNGQIKKTFMSSDEVQVTADFYPSGNPTDRYILLFHQGGSSRGEYNEIAPKLKKMGYNCLAVDLRYGNEVNFVPNETADYAKRNDLPVSYLDARKDMVAAIKYAYNLTNKRVILLGSSYSASLALLVAKNNSRVKAVIAFSPGEFFRPDYIMTQQMKHFDKKVFINGSKREYSYNLELTARMPKENRVLFTPSSGNCPHGAKALWDSNDSSEEIWLSLMLFINELKKDPFY